MGNNKQLFHGEVQEPFVRDGEKLEEPKKRQFLGDTGKLLLGSCLAATGALGKGEGDGFSMVPRTPEQIPLPPPEPAYKDPANIVIATGAGLIAASTVPEIVSGISRREFIQTTSAATATALALAPAPLTYSLGVANGRDKAIDDAARKTAAEQYIKGFAEGIKDEREAKPATLQKSK